MDLWSTKDGESWCATFQTVISACSTSFAGITEGYLHRMPAHVFQEHSARRP
jgi:hypothetical protein